MNNIYPLHVNRSLKISQLIQLNPLESPGGVVSGHSRYQIVYAAGGSISAGASVSVRGTGHFSPFHHSLIADSLPFLFLAALPVVAAFLPGNAATSSAVGGAICTR